MSEKPRETWLIAVHKDYLKFSAAHFLIFPDGTAERLHGHNYKVYVEVQSALDQHGLVLNFKDVKPLVRQLVDELDEYVLIPGKHPVLTAKPAPAGMLEIRYRERHYLIPQDEVKLLPIGNTSAENLATWLGREMMARMAQRWPQVRLQRLSVGVEETPGQQGIYTWEA